MRGVLEADEVLGGRYRLVSLVATGGMGQVWRATDGLLDRTVAVKVLKAEYASDPGFLDRFRSEARNSARLSHPNIAAVHDYGEAGGSGSGSAFSAYLVMELVPGEPLSDLIAREGALDPRRAGALTAATARGLAAAHRAGLVHRDVKPGNLMVTPDGSVKITDFGISRAAAQTPLTATGQVMGTAAYFSPEQAVGRREIGPEADLYALGVVLHEMLTGIRPFHGESQVAIAMAQVNQEPPSLPPEVGAGSAALVRALLVKEPEHRPHDAAAVAAAADALAGGDDRLALVRLDAALPVPRGGPVPAAEPTVVAPPVAPPATRVAAPATRVPPTATRVAPAGAAPGGASATDGWASPPARPARPQQPLRGAGVPGRGSRRMTTPLLGLIAVLVIVLLAAVYGIVTRSSDAPVTPAPEVSETTDPAPPAQDPEPTTEPSTPSTTTSPSPSATSSSTVTRTLPTQVPLPGRPTTGAPTPPGTTRPTQPPADGGSSSSTDDGGGAGGTGGAGGAGGAGGDQQGGDGGG